MAHLNHEDINADVKDFLNKISPPQLQPIEPIVQPEIKPIKHFALTKEEADTLGFIDPLWVNNFLYIENGEIIHIPTEVYIDRKHVGLFRNYNGYVVYTDQVNDLFNVHSEVIYKDEYYSYSNVSILKTDTRSLVKVQFYENGVFSEKEVLNNSKFINFQDKLYVHKRDILKLGYIEIGDTFCIKEEYEVYKIKLKEEFLNDKYIKILSTICEELYEENYEIVPKSEYLGTTSLNIHNQAGHIAIKYPEIEIVNSEGLKHTIKDLYVICPIVKTNDRYTLYPSIYAYRTSFTEIEVVNGYIHSHISSNNLLGKFCLGSGSIVANLQDCYEKITEDNFVSFCFVLNRYVRWESLEGRPHTYMRNLNHLIKVTNIETNSLYDYSHINYYTEEILKNYKKLKVKIVNNKIDVDFNSLEKLLTEISISKNFILYYYKDGVTYYSFNEYSHYTPSNSYTLLSNSIKFYYKNELLKPVIVKSEKEFKYPDKIISPHLTKTLKTVLDEKLYEYYCYYSEGD